MIKSKEYSFSEYTIIYKDDLNLRIIIINKVDIKIIEWSKDAKMFIIGKRFIYIIKSYLLP